MRTSVSSLTKVRRYAAWLNSVGLHEYPKLAYSLRGGPLMLEGSKRSYLRLLRAVLFLRYCSVPHAGHFLVGRCGAEVFPKIGICSYISTILRNPSFGDSSKRSLLFERPIAFLLQRSPASSILNLFALHPYTGLLLRNLNEVAIIRKPSLSTICPYYGNLI